MKGAGLGNWELWGGEFLAGRLVKRAETLDIKGRRTRPRVRLDWWAVILPHLIICRGDRWGRG